jgi:hypothetical protein
MVVRTRPDCPCRKGYLIQFKSNDPRTQHHHGRCGRRRQSACLDGFPVPAQQPLDSRGHPPADQCRRRQAGLPARPAGLRPDAPATDRARREEPRGSRFCDGLSLPRGMEKNLTVVCRIFQGSAPAGRGNRIPLGRILAAAGGHVAPAVKRRALPSRHPWFAAGSAAKPRPAVEPGVGTFFSRGARSHAFEPVFALCFP